MSNDDYQIGQDALDRMKRAHSRRTGCYLTAEMVAQLGLTVIGQMWEEPRPIKDQPNDTD